MSGKQIEFPEKQTHVKAFEYGMLIFSIICIIIVLTSSLPPTSGSSSVPPSEREQKPDPDQLLPAVG